jgi:peptide/nickel transport system permease protein
MVTFILRRISESFFVLLAMSLLVFAGVYAIGNPVDLLISPEATPQDIEQVTKSLGLDKPLWTQYFYFLKQVLKGDLGHSFMFSTPAIDLLLSKMPATMELAIAAMLIASVLGIPLGLIAGLKADSWLGKTIMAVSIFGFSLPTFWVGLVLIMFFSVQLGWLPSSGRGPTSLLLGIPVSFLSWEGIRHLFLPALNLALFKLALIIRLTRAGTQEALMQDYVRFARAKGLRESRIIGVHVLKNIMIPIVTVIGLEFGSVIAFSIVTESIFAWPGMGKLLIDSINNLDRPVIVAYLCLIVVFFVFINLAVDLIYALLDPRVRFGDSAQ